jgi:hypothetical protein
MSASRGVQCTIHVRKLRGEFDVAVRMFISTLLRWNEQCSHFKRMLYIGASGMFIQNYVCMTIF